MKRRHFDFISGVENIISKLGFNKVDEKPYRYKEYHKGDIVIIIPHVQKYTFSVHIKTLDEEQNFHSKEINYDKAIESFKEHIKKLWQ